MESHNEPDWIGARCIGRTPDGFFPERGTAQITARDAKKVCNGLDGQPECPLRAMCLEYALDRKERFGIWGGKSERERAAIAKQRRVAVKRRELEVIAAKQRRSDAAKAAWAKRRTKAVSIKEQEAAPAATRTKEQRVTTNTRRRRAA